MVAQQIPLITLDGPSGSGKGTIATLLAKQLGYNLLDSGAIYRVLAVVAENNGINFDDEDLLVEKAINLEVSFAVDLAQGKQTIILESADVSEVIRTEIVGSKASRIAALSSVREALLQRQRAFLKMPGLIADGRDMGTVVFPNAPLKFFLTASAEERAQRRFNQLKNAGENVTLGSLIEEIKARDERDTQRQVAPLKAAADAIVIDSTSLTIDQVMAAILAKISEHSIFKLN